MIGRRSSLMQTVLINKVGPEYRKVPLCFEAGGDSDDVQLEIVGTGTGSFHIGAVSLMPADNVRPFAQK
jgi:alpha-L-arabinofuranosidase